MSCAEGSGSYQNFLSVCVHISMYDSHTILSQFLICIICCLYNLSVVTNFV